mmetsp:Transcript_15331/g.42407  ORF Transcript_15331/g.42407 Transcript_15331/m.42407 type:complete len:83 (-) Transcript_15331:104-352(-)
MGGGRTGHVPKATATFRRHRSRHLPSPLPVFVWLWRQSATARMRQRMLHNVARIGTRETKEQQKSLPAIMKKPADMEGSRCM